MAVDAVLLRERLAFSSVEVQALHGELPAILLRDPIDDGGGLRSGRSRIRVEEQQRRPLDHHGWS
jgi:hypothetical protein